MTRVLSGAALVAIAVAVVWLAPDALFFAVAESLRARRGPAALFLLMLTIIISDTAQYYTGRLLGRRPLAPIISPKKTVEGAIGGFVFGALALSIAGVWWLPSVPAALRALLGVA